MRQEFLFGQASPRVDETFSGLRRIALNATAWLDRQPEWLQGHAQVFETLHRQVRWQKQRRPMYDRIVDVPRLVGAPDPGCSLGPLLHQIAEALSERYQRDLSSISLSLYRDGADSVAMHGDKLGPAVDDTVVAIVAVGFPRRFLVRTSRRLAPPQSEQEAQSPTVVSTRVDPLETPRLRGGSVSVSFGCGDLLVMGGSCQRDFEHGVPKAAHADGRISLMFREPLPAAHSEHANVPPSRLTKTSVTIADKNAVA